MHVVEALAVDVDELIQVVELGTVDADRAESDAERVERPRRAVWPQCPRRCTTGAPTTMASPPRAEIDCVTAGVTSAACAVATTTTAGSHISPLV